MFVINKLDKFDWSVIVFLVSLLVGLLIGIKLADPICDFTLSSREKECVQFYSKYKYVLNGCDTYFDK